MRGSRPAHGRDRVSIDGELFARTARASRCSGAVRGDRQRVAVEDELIVSADGIAVDDRHAVLRRDRAEHLAAALPPCRA